MEQRRLRGGPTPFCAAWLAVALALGCASPGPPQSPSLHLPSAAERLQARRVGTQVRLYWLNPATTTDGLKVSGPLTAVVCRELRQAGTRPNSTTPCDPVGRIAVTLGTAETVDQLPQELTTGAPALLAYRIELLNGRGRSAGQSDPVYAAAGETPAPVGPLTVAPRRGAALIQWQPQPRDSAPETAIELHRTLSASAQPSSKPFPSQPAAAPASRPRGALKPPTATPFGTDREPAGEVTLTVPTYDPSKGTNADPGGTLDQTVRDGNTYLYVAQRVKRLTLSGQALELRGAPSPPTPFTFRDIIAPRPPSGLVSVPGGGFGAPPAIDLSWDPSPETDLLGYNVYRQAAYGAFTRLNAEPVPSSAFRDTQVAPGQAYAYRVTAVDRRLNESAPSAEIHESLRQ